MAYPKTNDGPVSWHALRLVRTATAAGELTGDTAGLRSQSWRKPCIVARCKSTTMDLKRRREFGQRWQKTGSRARARG